MEESDTTQLENFKTTKSGAIRKNDALRWFKNLDEPSEQELIAAVTPKPSDHSGSTFPTPISNIRVTGKPEFITAVARLLKPLAAWESSATRLAIKLQKIEDRETGELTDNYALYLSAAVRGREGQMSRALLGEHSQEDQKLAKALEQAGKTY